MATSRDLIVFESENSGESDLFGASLEVDGNNGTFNVKERDLNRLEIEHRSFIEKLGNLNREINDSIEAKDSLDLIEEKVKAYDSLWRMFVSCHEKYLHSVKFGDREKAYADYDAVLKQRKEFDRVVKLLQKRREEDKQERTSSLFSKRSSCQSKRSTSSSVFLKKKEEFVIAQLKLQQLKKKHEIEKQYLEIKNKEQLLEAEMQQEQAKICLQIYEEFHNENREKENRNQLEDKAAGMSAFPEVIKTDYLQDTSVREDDRVSILQTSIRNPSNITVSNAAPTLGDNPTSANAQAMPILHNTSDLPVQEEYQSSSKVNLIQFEDPLQDLPATVTQQNATNFESIQTDKTEMLMQKLCQVVTNPRMEYLHFDGNPLRYVSFMHNFETCLESQNSDDSTKLQLLIQHCHGRAREAIESCVNLPVEEGYLSAKKTLKENFGKAHIIAKAHLDKLEKLPVIKRADGPSLLDFAQHLEVTYRSLYGMGVDYLSELNHVNTLRTLNKKLPTFLRAKWTDHAGGIIESGVRPRFEDFLSFLKRRASLVNNEFGDDLNMSLVKENNFKRENKVNIERKITTLATATNKPPQRLDSSVRCLFCAGSHVIWKCFKFNELQIRDRLEFVMNNNICLRCLNKGHYAKVCGRADLVCQVKGCGKNHHTILHGVNPFDAFQTPNIELKKPVLDGKSTDRRETKSNPTPNLASTTTAATGAGETRISLGVIPIQLQIEDSTFIKTYALLDTGSEVSLLSQKVADRLGYSGVKNAFTITGMTGSAQIDSEMFNITIKSLDGRSVHSLNSVKSVHFMSVNKGCIPESVDIQRWSHLRDIYYEHVEPREIGLLIGLKELPKLFVPLESRSGGDDEPIAVRYPLGWMILGRLGRDKIDSDYSVNFIQVTDVSDQDQSMRYQLDRLWNHEFKDLEVDNKACLSVDDKLALELVENSLKLEDGVFVVPMPWKHQPPELPNNKQLASKRLEGLKKRFIRDPELYLKYRETIQDYVQNGHAEIVPSEDLNAKSKSQPLWYLPHHPVIHPLKETVRVVFDCAASFRGTSLNQQLHQGPDLTNPLVGVLMRFRGESIGVVGDVKAMFHQVRVSKQDCDALRFLWWKDDDFTDQVQEYRMVKHIFGAKSSPFIANHCLRTTAKMFGEEFSVETVKTVNRDMYVDDLMKSVKTTEEALKLVAELKDLLARGGFHLRKWCSNDRDVVLQIPEEERAKSLVSLDLDNLPTESTLGLKWNTETDKFVWEILEKMHKKAENAPMTRRGVLSVVYSLFDPLGFLAPFLMKAKLLLQMFSRKGLRWDEQLGEADREQWLRWLSDLPQLSRLSVDRCYKPKSLSILSSVELHLFSDGSRVGYSSVAYLRFVGSDTRIHCAFVMGKSRLAPIKEISIPRLELAGAVLSVRLCRLILEELELPIREVTYWTDSMSVLKCINNTSKRFHTFESNRLTLIHLGSKPHQWRYINRDDNPADDGSKGLKLNSMINKNRWVNGPDFLWKEEGLWPKKIESPELADDDIEVRKEARIYATGTSDKEPDMLMKFIHHYSSWWRLKRAFAWILRFKRILYSRTFKCVNQNSDADQISEYLTVEEISAAEIEIIRYVQKEKFPDVIKSLSDQKMIKSSSSALVTLSPKIINGLICVGGRLRRASVDDHAKHPIIVPYKHHVTDIIISSFHLAVGHMGQESVLSALRQKYWVLNGRSAVRRVIRKCVTCQRQHKRKEQQFMADLPMERLQPDKAPFTYVGVDYFGPLKVKVGRSTAKRYGCLFTCLTTRAIHIEVAQSLNTDSMINCLRRFISVRGYPEKLLSDNGSNFTKADKELKEALMNMNQSKITDSCAQQDMIWCFNPPGASHMGGIWERMIRSVRQILNSVIREQLISDEVLLTVMAEAVLILNNRPLTRVSDSASDENPLTPNHLLHLRPCPTLPPGLFCKEDLYIRRQWRQAQYLSDVFWRRWVKEYIPTLIQRSKWATRRKNVEIGDIVLMADDNFPRGQWPLARIVDVHKSDDECVRSVDLKTSATVATNVKRQKSLKSSDSTIVLRRPITKICVLELE